MNKYMYMSLLITLTIIISTNPVYAACTDGKITVNTNIRDTFVYIKTSDINAKKSLEGNETWNIGKGYSLTVVSFNVTKDPRTVRLVFMKNNSIIDDQVLKQGTTYESKDFGAYIDSIFFGSTSIMVQLKYILFFSEPYFWMVPQEISGTGTTSSMSGNNMYYWESDNINFSTYETWKVSYGDIDGYLTPLNDTKTASNTNCMEFTGIYRSPNSAPEKPLITGNVLNTETGEPIIGAIVSIDENSNTTGSNGKYELRSDNGTYDIKVTKSGYSTITKSINVSKPETEIDFLLKTEDIISWWMIPLLLLGIIIPISIIYIILNKRKKNKKKEIKEVKVEKVDNIKDKRYCIHCKAQIPLDAEYCVICGKRQDNIV